MKNCKNKFGKSSPPTSKQWAALFAALFCSLVYAELNLCAAELQGMLFEPQTYAKDCMEKVANNFKSGSVLLFGPNANSYISAFEQQWGVSIVINEAQSICGPTTAGFCGSTQFSPEVTAASYTIPVTDDIIISSFTVAVTGASSTGGLGQYTLTSPVAGSTPLILSSTNICDGASAQAPFSIGFADGGAASIACNAESQNAGTLLAPTVPLSTLNGQSTLGDWTLAIAEVELPITTITLSYCSAGPSCSRDVMKALTNIPGFRFDSVAGMVYYTEDIFDAFGNFKQVTISRPIAGIYLKK